MYQLLFNLKRQRTLKKIIIKKIKKHYLFIIAISSMNLFIANKVYQAGKFKITLTKTKNHEK